MPKKRRSVRARARWSSCWRLGRCAGPRRVPGRRRVAKAALARAPAAALRRCSSCVARRGACGCRRAPARARGRRRRRRVRRLISRRRVQPAAPGGRRKPQPSACRHARRRRRDAADACPRACRPPRAALCRPQEWVKANPSRRPDIFPEFKPMKPALPQPMPGDPEVPDDEEEDEKNKKKKKARAAAHARRRSRRCAGASQGCADACAAASLGSLPTRTSRRRKKIPTIRTRRSQTRKKSPKSEAAADDAAASVPAVALRRPHPARSGVRRCGCAAASRARRAHRVDGRLRVRVQTQAHKGCSVRCVCIPTQQSAVPRQARSSASQQRLLGGIRLGRGRRLARRCRCRRRRRGRPLLAGVRRVQLRPQAVRVSARRVKLRLQRRLLRLRRGGRSGACGATRLRVSAAAAAPRDAARRGDARTHAPGAHTCLPAGAAKRRR